MNNAIGRFARGLGATMLTGNLGAGMVAAGTNSFTAGTLFGVASNLMNPYGMYGGYGMMGNAFGLTPMNGTMGGYNAFATPMNGTMGGYNAFATPMNGTMGGYGGFGTPMNGTMYSPFSMGYGYNPMGFNMWNSMW